MQETFHSASCGLCFCFCFRFVVFLFLFCFCCVFVWFVFVFVFAFISLPWDMSVDSNVATFWGIISCNQDYKNALKGVSRSKLPSSGYRMRTLDQKVPGSRVGLQCGLICGTATLSIGVLITSIPNTFLTSYFSNFHDLLDTYVRCNFYGRPQSCFFTCPGDSDVAETRYTSLSILVRFSFIVGRSTLGLADNPWMYVMR